MKRRNLMDIPAGSHVFVDTNVLVLAIIGTDPLSTACQQFLHRTRTSHTNLSSNTHVYTIRDRERLARMAHNAGRMPAFPGSAIVAPLKSDWYQLQGYTATFVVAEVIHRIMVNNARLQLGLSAQETVQYLQQHPEMVQQLRDHLQIASDVRNFGLNILPLTVKDLHASKIARSHYGLMTNDSLIFGVMRNEKLHNLATHDAGFLRVSSLQVWMPQVRTPP